MAAQYAYPYSPGAARASGREHVPAHPARLVPITRIVQGVVALFVAALSGYGISWAVLDGDVFILVVAVFTLVSTAYHLVAVWADASFYNYWAVLVIDMVLVVLWLASCGTLAADVTVLKTGQATYYDFGEEYLTTVTWTGPAIDSLAAAAGLGGLEAILFLITLVVHAVMVRRHRAAGLHCLPSTRAGAGAGVGAGTQAYVDKHPADQSIPLEQPRPTTAPMATPQTHVAQAQAQGQPQQLGTENTEKPPMPQQQQL